MYRRYYSYNDMPVPVKTEPKTDPVHTTINKSSINSHQKKGLLDNLKVDDIIILAVIFILFMDECDDILLLAALAFIFLNRE